VAASKGSSNALRLGFALSLHPVLLFTVLPLRMKEEQNR
jgi:hypothetical protein